MPEINNIIRFSDKEDVMQRHYYKRKTALVL